MSPYTPDAFAMAKRFWTFYDEEPDLDKRISYLEQSCEYVDYIPNLIQLANNYSIRSKIKQLQNIPEKDYSEEKKKVEKIFDHVRKLIEENNRRITKKERSFYHQELHNHNLYYGWGEHCRRWEEYDKAVKFFQQAITEIEQYKRKSETDEKILVTCTVFIAQCYIELKNYPLAQKILDDIEKNKNPYHPYLLTGRGELFLAQSQSLGISAQDKDEYFRKSALYFTKAIAINPENYFLDWCLSKLYLLKGDQKQALEFLRQAQKKVETSDNAINKLKIGIELQIMEENNR